MDIDQDPLSSGELSLTNDEKRLAAYGWYKTANIPSSESHRDVLVNSVNKSFGLNVDREHIWANDEFSLWLLCCEGSFYVINIDTEFAALVADNWETAIENLLQEEQAYEGPVRRAGQKYDRNANDESDILEEWYENKASGVVDLNRC